MGRIYRKNACLFLFLLGGIVLKTKATDGFLSFGEWKENKSDSARKPTPRIGLLLPLSGGPESKNRSETALEFYKGMILANEICTALDSGLEFHVFDHRNQAAEFRNIASEGCLNGLDLFIGPMRQSLIPLMDSLAAAKKVPVMNVLTQGTYPDASPWLHSQQTSLQAIAENCFAFVKEKAQGSKAGIVYGTEKNDSLLAAAYRKICIENGKKIALFRKVGKNSAANLSKYISEAGLDSSSHLFVSNNETLVRLQLLSAYGVLQGKFPVLINGKWLESGNAELEEYSSVPFFFANPDLALGTAEIKRDYEKNFIARWGNPPGWVAWKGFDLAMMLSRQWYNSGKDKFEFNQNEASSVLFGQYQFMPGKAENQYCPIFQVGQNGILKVWP